MDHVLSQICELIKKQYASDAEFENSIGLKPRTVNDWKREKSHSYLKKLPELSKHFNVPITFFYGNDPIDNGAETETKEKPTVKDDELIKKINERPLLKSFVENLSKMDDESIRAFMTIAGLKFPPQGK